MESDIEQQWSQKRNDTLSHSYVQAVERVTQRSIDDAGFSFNLPKEVLEEREKAWSSFFDKYTKEASSGMELNIKTMEPVGSPKKNVEVVENKEEAEGEEEKEYYSKCRAPIRKLPALIQYWVDTGNPPYQLVWEEEHSGTGSSLSEGDCSRSSGRSALVRESLENDKVDENSGCSSVDTAAYVLSNGNVTEKAKTMEIMMECGEENEAGALRSLEREARTKVSAEPGAASRASTSNKRSNLTLSEVLPALQQFDQLLEVSERREEAAGALRTPGSPGDRKDPEESRSVDVSSKTSNRRKLYTGRNSPTDLILARRSTDNATTTTTTTTTTSATGGISHPALESTVETSENRSTLLLANRVRARRKRKRAAAEASQRPTLGPPEAISERHFRDDKINNNDRAKEGHERYEDFFQSLGLTPSKTAIERDEEDEDDEDEDGGKKTDSAPARNGLPPSAFDLLGDRALSVRLVKLSDEFLARYRRPPRRRAASSCDPSSERNPAGIELLTTATHDSDSSTILICSCNSRTNNGPTCASDYSLSFKGSDSPATNGVFSGKLNIAKTTSRDVEAAEAEGGNSIDCRIPRVSLDRLAIDERPDSRDDPDYFRSGKSPGRRRRVLDESSEIAVDKYDDEDDDNFTKLVQKVASTRPNDSEDRRSSRKPSRSIFEACKPETRRSRDIFGIAPSSDEDETRTRSGCGRERRRGKRDEDGLGGASRGQNFGVHVASNEDLFTGTTDEGWRARRRAGPGKRRKRGKRRGNFDEPSTAPTRFRTRLDSDSDSVDGEPGAGGRDVPAEEPSHGSDRCKVGEIMSHRLSRDETKAAERRKNGVEASLPGARKILKSSPRQINASVAAAEGDKGAEGHRRKPRGPSGPSLPDIFDDTLENVDGLIFSGGEGRSRNAVKNFRLETAPRLSTITFRTRLTDDSDHDDDVDF